MTWALESYKPYKEERREGDIVSRISGDVEAVVRAVAGPLNGLLPMVLKMIGSVVMMFVWSPVLGAISLVLVLPLYAASKRVAVKSKEIATEQRAANGRLVGAVGDLLYCIPIIKAWGSERFEAAGFHAFSHQMYTLNRKSQRIFNVYWGITYTLMTIGYLSAVVFSARSALAGAATAGSIAVAFPLGVMSGIYVSEYARDNWLVRVIRVMTSNLSGVPSIVFGLFGMALFVKYLGFGDSILAGSLTLGLLSLPLVIRTTEEALKDIPSSFREGSLALGASKLQTIWKVILPMGMPRIITGLILSLGRVSGETAPILFTCAAYFFPQLPASVFDQCMALPYHLYVISTSGTDIEAQQPIAYGTALVLVAIILVVNLLAGGLRRYFENRLKTK